MLGRTYAETFCCKQIVAAERPGSLWLVAVDGKIGMHTMLSESTDISLIQR